MLCNASDVSWRNLNYAGHHPERLSRPAVMSLIALTTSVLIGSRVKSASPSKTSNGTFDSVRTAAGGYLDQAEGTYGWTTRCNRKCPLVHELKMRTQSRTRNGRSRPATIGF
ncbi:uncharacterized protein LOC119766883 [Culex quinquefasciatus]|uniref:uncharacterized protein LOC119766883 n=1 Tax=Culex quinquefasciatus TaxID=7176 RepID=UPI0018E35F2D|nr:uncharacterized protein LOC119766883 [Culex quinquefasciatus]